jgi:hypothetical protein
MRFALILLPVAALTLSGCIARTALDIVTLPVKAAGQVVDWTTTSQDESDRSLGREVRAREEAIGRLERQRREQRQRCENNDGDACAEAERIAREIAILREGST